MFSDAIDSIAGRLTGMRELAKKARSPDYSPVQVEEMQEQFQNLAEEINETVQGAEYDYNRPFAAGGKTLSIRIGNGSKIDIFAKDFSFDAQGLNIATDPQNALSKVNEAIAKVNEYKQYLGSQVSRLEDATAVIESEAEGAMGVDLNDFKPDIALEMAAYAASMISEDRPTSLDTQANLTPSEALQLLKDGD
jgi:flagellin